MRRGLSLIVALTCAAAWAQPNPTPEANPPAAAPVAAAAPSALPSTAKPRLTVLDVRPQDTTPQQAAAFTDGIVAALNQRGLFEVISQRDIETLLGTERQKQLMGLCDSDSSACAHDVSASLNSRFVLSGQLSKVGAVFQLTLQMVDTDKGAAVARSTRLAGSLEALRDLVPYAAAEATGMPLPPPPSRLLPISLMVLGGGAIVAGGVVGLLALSEQSQLNDELCPGGVIDGARCTGVNLRPRSFYVQKQGDLANREGLAIGLLAGGAVLAGLGYWLLPPTPKDGGVALRAVPTGSGFALVGGF